MGIKSGFERVSRAYADSRLIQIGHMVGVYLGMKKLWPDADQDTAYRTFGIATAAVGATLDTLSTLPAVRMMNSEEYKNSDGGRLMESSPLLGRNPSMKQFAWRSALTSTLVVGASAFVPEIGYVYLSLTPFMVANNLSRAREFRESMIG